MATTNYDHKAGVDEISDDIAPTATPGIGAPHSKLVPPPLVAAMSREERAAAEAKMRRKIDIRLMPMIILMYIMNCKHPTSREMVRILNLAVIRSRQKQYRGRATSWVAD